MTTYKETLESFEAVQSRMNNARGPEGPEEIRDLLFYNDRPVQPRETGPLTTINTIIIEAYRRGKASKRE